MAYELNMDPVALRARNEPTRDPTTGHEFSLRNLLEAYRRGAEHFNWQPRPPRTQREGEWLVGQGVASAEYAVLRQPASAKICLYADGTAVVKAAAHEMGMGTATVQLQHAADRLGLPISNVSFQYGDTDLPKAAIAGGSMQTISVAAGISAAAEELLKQLFDLAKKAELLPLRDFAADKVELKTGGLYHQQQAAQGRAYADILKAADLGFLEVEGTSAMPLEIMKYSMQSYGAQFAEVRVNEITGEVRVARWVGAFDVGRILNVKTATSQLRGGIIMGIGMALTEETLFDERTGRIINASLAEYHVPVNADVPPIDAIFLDIPDEHTPLGAHGIGEIGITGAVAAVANAIFNATGTRIRSLPLTLDKVLAGGRGRVQTWPRR
ncbi:MAG: molybdopterin cofactor-binding domain-containing protein [Hymenobacter sp.]